MKIVVNEKKRQERMNDLFRRILKEGEDTAKRGKTHFTVALGYDELNGFNHQELKEQLKFRSEDSVQFEERMDYSEDYLYLSIVE
jgi:hypothetical protein